MQRGYGYFIILNSIIVGSLFYDPSYVITPDPVIIPVSRVCLFHDRIVINPLPLFCDPYPFNFAERFIRDIDIEKCIIRKPVFINIFC